MQQFVVPQFIDVEGKIIGPITTRQFVIMLIGGLGIFIAFRLGNFTSFLITTIFIVIIVSLFAFAKVNGRPFHYFLINIIQTIFLRQMLRVWQREDFIMNISKSRSKKEQKEDEAELVRSKEIQTPLEELALIVDTGGVYQAEEEVPYGF